MKKCDVCGNSTFHQEQVEDVFHIDRHVVMVENIPARVCDRCGDATFGRETVEHIRRLVHGEKRPVKRVRLDVFAYA